MKYRFGSFNMNNMGMSAMTGRDFDRIAEIIKRENLDVVALYNKAEKLGVWELLQSAFPYEAFALPFKRRMSEVEIYEMNLSVRASNGLMRAGAKTLGKVAELVALPRKSTASRSARGAEYSQPTKHVRADYTSSLIMQRRAQQAQLYYLRTNTKKEAPKL